LDTEYITDKNTVGFVTNSQALAVEENASLSGSDFENGVITTKG